MLGTRTPSVYSLIFFQVPLDRGAFEDSELREEEEEEGDDTAGRGAENEGKLKVKASYLAT